MESRLSFRQGRIYYDLLAAYRPDPSIPPLSARDIALHMATCYYRDLPGFCAGLFEAAEKPSGYALRPRGIKRFDLLRVFTPIAKGDDARGVVSFPIAGGLLALPRQDSGRFIFEACVCPEGNTLLVRVARFSPLIAGDGSHPWRVLLYRSTQSLFHRIIIAGFLRAMVRELSSARRPVRVPIACRWVEEGPGPTST